MSPPAMMRLGLALVAIMPMAVPRALAREGTPNFLIIVTDDQGMPTRVRSSTTLRMSTRRTWIVSQLEVYCSPMLILRLLCAVRLVLVGTPDSIRCDGIRRAVSDAACLRT